LGQIDYAVDGSLVYHPEYPYRTGVTKELSSYQSFLCDTLLQQLKILPSSLVVDVGSNDGTLLAPFQAKGNRVLGIEPTKAGEAARKKGIPTLQAFFGEKTAEMVRAEYGAAKLITSTNVFAHMTNLGDVIRGIYHLLDDDGYFVFENHYLLDILEGVQFDSMYHEHLRSYSLRSILALFDFYDFTVMNACRVDRYGGSIRVYVTKGKGRPVSDNINAMLVEEARYGLQNAAPYTRFAERCKQAKQHFMELAVNQAAHSKPLVGNSCPARSVVLVNYYGLDTGSLPYIAEQPTSPKLDHYLPVKNIPIVTNKRLISEQPEYVVLLAWHLWRPISSQLRARGLRSKFVVPLPEFQIVEP
jgi:SAM-dependent methyltransferase